MLRFRIALASITLAAIAACSPTGRTRHEPLARRSDALISWGQQAKVVAASPVGGEMFGWSVAIDGDTALVGAPSAGAGAVYVFVRSGAAWTQQARLTSSDGLFADHFGQSVALDGDTAVIGAPIRGSDAGAAYMFTRSGTTWTEQASLDPGVKLAMNDRFGTSVAIDGGVIAVGAYGRNAFAGAVYLFGKVSSKWTLTQTLGAATPVTNDQFGTSVALSSSLLVVGAPTGVSAGRAITFIPVGIPPNTWVEWKTIGPSDPAPGAYFGLSAATQADTVAVGSSHGAVYVWTKDPSYGKLAFQQKVVGIDTTIADAFGASISLEGDTLVVGSRIKGGYVFTRVGTLWSQTDRMFELDPETADEFGGSIALSGDAAIVGARSKGSDDRGAAYLFRYLLPKGDACTTNAQCLTNICVDGTCCDRACTGQCEACDAAASKGTCTTITGAPHGTRAACGGDASECGTRTCDGVSLACVLPGPTKPCGATACSAGVETHVGKCNGSGLCDDTPKTCGAYKCGVAACGTTCAVSGDCATGYYCAPPACVPFEGLGKPCSLSAPCAAPLFCTDGVCCGTASCDVGSTCADPSSLGTCIKKNAAACSGALECASGHCVDGVCCDTTCTGQCEACDLAAPSLGKCTPISGEPHGKLRAPCSDGAGDACKAATCNGAADATKCVGFVNGTTKSCGAATCSGTTFTAAPTCDGAGACKPPTSSSCIPYVCDASGCLKRCDGDAQCADKFRCVKNECIEGARCSPDGLSSIGKDGVPVPCGVYKCGSDGRCLQGCATADDCVNGLACNPDTKTCEGAPPGTGGDGGCALSTSASTTGVELVAGALATMALLARRRRREGLPRR